MENAENAEEEDGMDGNAKGVWPHAPWLAETQEDDRIKVKACLAGAMKLLLSSAFSAFFESSAVELGKRDNYEGREGKALGAVLSLSYSCRVFSCFPVPEGADGPRRTRKTI